MARTVSVGKLQQMQREAQGSDAANGDSRFPGFQNPAQSVSEQLQALVLRDDIAGMPLGQVVGLVRLAVEEAHVNATEQEIRDEAERRRSERADADAHLGTGYGLEEAPVGPKPARPEAIGEMGYHAAMAAESKATAHIEPGSHETAKGESEHVYGILGGSQRVYDVALDGIVQDVRPAEMTPDRGPDVGETHHQVTDEERRFSGGGDGQAQQASLFLVPSDSAFNGKLYRDAPELANIAETLIDRHGFLAGLINCEIRFYWRRKTGVSKGRVKIGYCKRASDLLGHFSGADFIIWLSATTARDGKFTDRQVEAAIFHQLLHIETDDEGNFISARHDFEGFAAEVRVYGTWTEDLKLGGQAFTAAHQMGLFDQDDEGIEDDDEDAEEVEGWEARARDDGDGSGVLIHADGSPLTDDEIEAMEVHELGDHPFMGAAEVGDDGSGLDCAVCGGYVDMERGGNTCDDCRARSRDDDFVDGQAVDDQRPYADEEPAELSEQRPRDPFMGEPDTSGELPTGPEIDAARAPVAERDILLDDPI